MINILKLTKIKFSSMPLMLLLIMFVAILSTLNQHGHINRDGLLYIKQAYYFAEGQWEDALKLYSWPFFSILLAFFHKVTNIHLQLVAHIVDLILFSVASFFYLKILLLINNEKKNIFYGGLILLSFVPLIDDYVGMVLRDHGLWAGSMFGSYFYFKSIKQKSFKNTLMWQLGFLIAGLFRPEGILMMILIPLWNCFMRRTKTIKQFFSDYILITVLIISLIFLALFSSFDSILVSIKLRFMDFADGPIEFFKKLIRPLPVSSDNFFMENLLQKNSLVITYSLLATILIYKWIKGIGFFHGILFYYSLKQKNNIYFNKEIYFFLIISFLLVCINLLNVYVLTNRYWCLHWWWLFILVTPVLKNLFEHKNINKIIKYIASIVIGILILNSFIDSSSNIELEVAKYINQNQISSINYNNNLRIKYYVTRDIVDYSEDSSHLSYKYSLIKSNDVDSLDKSSIVEIFPKNKTKFILINNE